jgi:hypothetical protein
MGDKQESRGGMEWSCMICMQASTVEYGAVNLARPISIPTYLPSSYMYLMSERPLLNSIIMILPVPSLCRSFVQFSGVHVSTS